MEGALGDGVGSPPRSCRLVTSSLTNFIVAPWGAREGEPSQPETASGPAAGEVPRTVVHEGALPFTVRGSLPAQIDAAGAQSTPSDGSPPAATALTVRHGDWLLGVNDTVGSLGCALLRRRAVIAFLPVSFS